MGPIKPVNERVAIYQLLLELKRGLTEDEEVYDCLRLWARQGFSFGRDYNGTVVMLDPQEIEIEPEISIPW